MWAAGCGLQEMMGGVFSAVAVVVAQLNLSECFVLNEEEECLKILNPIT